jgi:hypothetical protein
MQTFESVKVEIIITLLLLIINYLLIIRLNYRVSSIIHARIHSMNYMSENLLFLAMLLPLVSLWRIHQYKVKSEFNLIISK